MATGQHRVEVVVEDARWSDLDRIASVAVPAALDVTCGYEVVVMGCDDARIAGLNGRFRDKPQPTNVLSWPSGPRHPDTPPSDTELGDIAIAYETCVREAAEQGKSFEAHVTHLLVHATLHLLGHDHEAEAEAKRMEATERRIVMALGFPDPYADVNI
ncbi:MAG: rRNA maturation RNase YbeY [Pseudomonadota bacterium]